MRRSSSLTYNDPFTLVVALDMKVSSPFHSTEFLMDHFFLNFFFGGLFVEVIEQYEQNHDHNKKMKISALFHS